MELNDDPMDVNPDSDTECVAAAAAGEKKTKEKEKAAKAAKPPTDAKAAVEETVDEAVGEAGDFAEEAGAGAGGEEI